MALFGRRNPEPKGVLPAGYGAVLERYGRWEFDPQSSGLSPASLGNGNIEYELWTLAQPDPDAFIAAMAGASTTTGGWALYGGSRAIWNAVGTDVQHPDYLRTLDASIEFLRSQGFGTQHLASFEFERWNVTKQPGDAW